MDVAFAIFFFVTLGMFLGLLLALLMITQRYGQFWGEAGVPMHPGLMGLARRVSRVGRWFGDRYTPASERLLNLAHGHIVSQYIVAAVQTGIVDAFDREPRPAAAVAEQLHLHEETVARLLRVLAAHGCFEVMGMADHMYRHNSVSILLRADHPQSLRPTMLVLAESFASWAGTTRMLATGTPVCVERSGGQPFWEMSFPPLVDDGPLRTGDGLLRDAVTARSRLSDGALLVDYRWSDHERILDLGGGPARLLSAILKANPTLVGVVWDQQATIAATQAWWARFAETVAERVRFVGGSGFDALPPLRTGDALLLGFVLSTLDDETAIEGLVALREHVGNESVTLLVADMVLEDRELTRLKLSLDAQVRGLGPIQQRTRAAWRALLMAGGFRVEEFVDIRGCAGLIKASALPVRVRKEVGVDEAAEAATPPAEEKDVPLLSTNAA